MKNNHNNKHTAHYDYHTHYDNHAQANYTPSQGYSAHHDAAYGRDASEFEYDDMFNLKGKQNMNIKKDFLQAIGSVFGATNQHATQINYNINMFSSGLDHMHGANYIMATPEVIPSNHVLDTFEMSPLPNSSTKFRRELNVKTKESREPSPMVIRQH